MRAKPIVSCVVVGILCVSLAEAQEPPSPVLDKIRRSLAEEIAGASPASRRPDIANDIDYLALVARRAGPRSVVGLLQQFEEERSDKQIGGGTNASGTTTVVSKGTVPKILGFAVENGAIAQDVSGTTVTFRGNVGGAIRTLAGKGLFPGLDPVADPAFMLLNRFSFSASFDTTRGNAADAELRTFRGDQQQLSEWTGRIQIINQRDPQSPQALQRWRARVLAPQQVLTVSTAGVVIAFQNDPAVQQWLMQTVADVQQARTVPAGKPPAQLISDIESALRISEASFPAGIINATAQALDAYEGSARQFITEREALLKALASGTLVSLEYTNTRPVKAPKTHNARLIAEVGSLVDLTGNVAVTFFEEIPVGATRQLSNVEAAVEATFSLGSARTVGAFALAFSGKYVHQLENSFTDDGVMVPDTKGTLAIGQIKLTVPVKGSGVKIPLSVTFANRTEFIKESVVRANVGLTYDLDILFARFRP